MNLLLELFLFAGIFFPIYHILNVIPTLFKKRINGFGIERAMSIIIPCYNEEQIIATTIEGIQRINYQNYECIFVNDGSSDHTMRNMKRRLKLKKINIKNKHNLDSKKIKSIYRSSKYPKILVLDKENGGKSDALNAGINFSKNDYLITLDADSILHVNALKFVNEAFNDPEVVAVSGIIQILQSFNFSKDTQKTTLKINPLLRLQTIEYIKSCFCYKASLAKLNSLLVISGAFGVFRKDIILDVNGFNHLIGEDLDLTLRIQFKIEGTTKKIVYVPDAICYTEGPETFRDFLKQRIRWQKSFIESLFTFKNLIFKNTFKKHCPFL
ncbi:MAG: glycosyltransferase family 2 protein [Bacilli bacterium]|nr:glycosyltransferase family 2 protein [Bacilli bacterium]